MKIQMYKLSYMKEILFPHYPTFKSSVNQTPELYEQMSYAILATLTVQHLY